MQKLSKQLVNSLIITAVIAVAIVVLKQIGVSEQFIHPQIWPIVIFSAVVGIIIVMVNHWGISTLDPQSRTNVFLATTGLRLVLSMAFLGIMTYIGLGDYVVTWVVNFFAVYLLYLVFEIYSILSNLRAISREGEKPL